MSSETTIIEASAKGAKVYGLAYSGGKMSVSGWDYEIAIDLSGLVIPASVPLLANHENRTASRVGIVAAKIELNGIIIEGEVMSDAFAANDIVEQAKAGGDWQLSVGVEVKKFELVEAGQTRFVNGQQISGAFYHVTESVLREVSVVAVGADVNTVMRVAAAYVIGNERKEKAMPEEKKVETEVKAEAAPTVKPVEEKETKVAEVKAEFDPTATIREEHKRIAEVKAACAGYPEIETKAIAEGMSVVEAKAMILDAIKARAGSEINASYVNVGAGSATGTDVIEAAAILGTGAVRNPEKHYAEKVLDAADKYRNMGIKDMIRMACASEGKHVEAAASVSVLAEAGFSTVSLPKMLGNVANKALLAAYTAMPSTAAMLAEKLSVNNFHEHTGVKLGGLGRMEKVQNGGPIKSGTMSEEYFTYRVNTVAKLIGLTREMIVNDDLGGFVRLAQNLGQSAFNAREFDFWALVLANTSDFFGNTNANQITTVLSIDAISEAVAKMMVQTGIDGEPINVSARYLVVPPQLAGTAKAIYAGNAVQGSTAKTSNANIYQNVYEPVVTPYLQNSAVSDNYSTTAWYLWSENVKPFGIAYLGGSENPVVEEVQTSAEYLGRTWRAYMDYGVCQIDHRGAVKSTGASAS